MIRLLLILIISVLYFIFVIYNMEEKTALKYIFGLSTQPLPIYLLVLGSLIVGMLLAGILILPGWVQMRMEMRRQRKTIEQMEDELGRLAETVSTKSGRSAYADEMEET